MSYNWLQHAESFANINVLFCRVYEFGKIAGVTDYYFRDGTYRPIDISFSTEKLVRIPFFFLTSNLISVTLFALASAMEKFDLPKTIRRMLSRCNRFCILIRV